MALNFLHKILLVVGLFFPAIVMAHGDAAWIAANPDFLRRFGSAHCCNPYDCGVIPDSTIKRSIVDTGKTIEIWKDGKIIDRFEKGEKGTYKSIDERWWWCRAVWAAPEEQVRNIYCIFYPVGVM